MQKNQFYLLIYGITVCMLSIELVIVMSVCSLTCALLVILAYIAIYRLLHFNTHNKHNTL